LPTPSSNFTAKPGKGARLKLSPYNFHHGLIGEKLKFSARQKRQKRKN